MYRIKKTKTTFKIYIADPGEGLVTYELKEFAEHWCGHEMNDEIKGIGLILEPISTFGSIESEKAVKQSKFRFLGRYISKYKLFLIQLIVGLILGSLIQLILPFLTQAIVDTGISSNNLNFIVLILIAQLVLLLSNTLIDFIRRKVLLYISTRINVTLISDFFIKLMRLPMVFFDAKLLGDLIQRVDDHDRIQRFITTQSLGMIFSVFNIIILGAVLLIYNIEIFSIFLIGSLLYGLWLFLFLKKRKQYDYKYFALQATNKGKVYQLINGMQEIKQQGCELRKREEWEETQADLFELNETILSLQQRQRVGSIFIAELRNVLITFTSATAVIHGDMTLGMMLAVQYIVGQLNSPVELIMNFTYDYQDFCISLERMREIYDKEDEDAIEGGLVDLPGEKGIVLKDVSFQYGGPDSAVVLDKLNLTIPEGKVTAIVGASGSGKTTLIKLLLGYYVPSSGTISIGDVQLKCFNSKWWRTQCGAVLQEGFIFSDSIARNIAVADNEIDQNKLLEAVSIANIKDVISQLPLSFKTKIGQDGQSLSQGQKQRILIARAVYKNPPFLFFDEATNALDANNEKAILNNLSHFYKGKTVVIVAHRLSTVMNADNIIVLNNGRITEEGTHEALTMLRKEYYTLVRNQLELGL